MKYSAWNKFHAYYEGNKADLYFKIISPRLRCSEVSNFLKKCLDNEKVDGHKTQFATGSWNFQSTTAVCINERRMFMPWKKSVITSVSVFFLPFCKHHWRHLYFNVFWSSPCFLRWGKNLIECLSQDHLSFAGTFPSSDCCSAHSVIVR